MHPIRPGLRGATLVAVALFTLAARGHAQQTLVVGTGGFPTIPSAVQAANAGDTVLVLGGVHQLQLDIDKGIRIVGRGGPQLAWALFPHRIHDVPAGETFSMTGFVTRNSGTPSDTTVRVSNCSGIVTLENLGQAALNRWQIDANDCAQLHLGGVALRGSNVVDSNVVFSGCGFDPVLSTGLSIDGGRTVLVSCTLNGGLFPSPAARLVDGEVAITRSDLVASLSSPAIVTSGGAILLDPSSRLVPGTGQPAVAGPAAVATFEFGSLVATSDGQQLTMQAHGPAGAPFLTLLSLPATESGTQFGLTWIEPAAFWIVADSVFPGTRLHTSSLPHPSLPAGTMVAMQTAFVTPAGVALGTPSLVTNP